MDYSKFYTPPEIATLLIGQLKVSAPDSIIDICCGSCNLLHAAHKRWSKADLFGVDVVEHRAHDMKCIQSDGRRYAIEHANEFSLVLANPPFDFVSKKREFPELYDILPSKYATSRLEIEMLLANLRILNENGTLMIIMPSTFANAESHRKIRKYIGEKYHVQQIIHLPDETFGSTKISSCALIIKRDSLRQRYTNRMRVSIDNSQYSISKPINVPQCQIRRGDWGEVSVGYKELFKLDFRRGNISSQSFIESGLPILHTAKMQTPWKPSIRYIGETNPSSNEVYAENGDIIVSRIGKSAGQWCKYLGEKVLISDCLYRIKDPTGIIAQTLTGESYSGQLKGVATRYITMADFNAWYKSLTIQ